MSTTNTKPRRKTSAELTLIQRVTSTFTVLRKAKGRKGSEIHTQNVLALGIGFVISGLLPFIVHVLTHSAAPIAPLIEQYQTTGTVVIPWTYGIFWFIALGGLGCSFPTVAEILTDIFNSRIKAVSATILIELTMVFSPVNLPGLGYLCLALLIGLNWVNTACKLARGV